MRVILDTNVLVSGLLISSSRPAALLTLWRNGRFTLISADAQMDELRRVLHYPKIQARLPKALAGRLVNDVRALAQMVGPLPQVDRSPDMHDNYLLALAEIGAADYLVTGDKSDLLALGKHQKTRILTARDFPLI